MALTIQQIQDNITNKADQREIINQLADYIQANPSGGGGSSYLPLDLTDDVTSVTNTLDESWGSVLNVTHNAETWFQGFRLGNFDASHWDSGFEQSGFNTPGYELSISDKLLNDGNTNYSCIRGASNTILLEVFDADGGLNTGDIQIGNPQILVASYEDNGNQGAEIRTRISPNRITQMAYDASNESEIIVHTDRVLTTFAEKNGDPDASDIPDTYYAVYKHTGTNAIKLWVNDGGTFKSVELTA